MKHIDEFAALLDKVGQSYTRCISSLDTGMEVLMLNDAPDAWYHCFICFKRDTGEFIEFDYGE